MALAAIHGALLALTASIINQQTPEPYMDEIFHIPQAQRYCLGDYKSWDEKITTPPGLYLLSRGLAWLSGHDWLCSTSAGLRTINLIFAFCLFPLISRLLALVHPAAHHTLFALALVWFPVNLFFAFFYYTDAGSTFFVLLSYLLTTQKRYALAGSIGLLSMTFRQTNLIWVCLFFGLGSVDILKEQEPAAAVDMPCCDVDSAVSVIQVITRLLQACIRHRFILMQKLYMFLVAIASFAVFLVWNGGIVLGDRTNHIAGLHFAQLLYFSSFLSFFALPWILDWDGIKACVRFVRHAGRKRWLGMLCVACAMLYIVRYHTYEHPFLLSDNRHYSFYVWKNIYRRHWSIRYLLIPAYMVSGWFNLRALLKEKENSLLFVIGYVATLILTLVPSPLLEFRYYILPFIFYAIHLGPPKSFWRTALAIAGYLVIHVVTLYLYLYRPFVWGHQPDEIQRFMW